MSAHKTVPTYADDVGALLDIVVATLMRVLFSSHYIHSLHWVIFMCGFHFAGTLIGVAREWRAVGTTSYVVTSRLQPTQTR